MCLRLGIVSWVTLAARHGAVCPCHETRELGADLAARIGADLAPGEHQKVHGGCLVETDLLHNVTSNASNPAPRNRRARSATQRHDEQPPVTASPSCVNRPRAGTHADTAAPKLTAPCLARAFSHPGLASDCQASPPLRPPPLQHLPAVGSAHALQESVRALPLAPVRLVGPLHDPSNLRISV